MLAEPPHRSTDLLPFNSPATADGSRADGSQADGSRADVGGVRHSTQSIELTNNQKVTAKTRNIKSL